jgi:hypothetical protein
MISWSAVNFPHETYAMGPESSSKHAKNKPPRPVAASPGMCPRSSPPIRPTRDFGFPHSLVVCGHGALQQSLETLSFLPGDSSVLYGSIPDGAVPCPHHLHDIIGSAR